MKRKISSSVLWLLFAVPAFIFLSGAVRSCACCELASGDCGLYITMSMEDEDSLPDGTYDIYAEVDDIEVLDQCVVENFPDKIHCTDNAQQIDSMFMYIMIWKDDPQIDFHASYGIPPGEGDAQGSTAGPEHVTIRVELDGVPIGEGEWWPEYERDLEHWGHEDCGYCDLAVEDELLLTNPE